MTPALTCSIRIVAKAWLSYWCQPGWAGGFDFMASQPTPPDHVTPPPLGNKGLIAGLIKGNQWLLGVVSNMF